MSLHTKYIIVRISVDTRSANGAMSVQIKIHVHVLSLQHYRAENPSKIINYYFHSIIEIDFFSLGFYSIFCSSDSAVIYIRIRVDLFPVCLPLFYFC